MADRITVLRDGAVTGVVEKGNTDAHELSRLMVGRELMELDRKPVTPGEKVLEVSDVSIRGTKGKPVLDGVNMDVRAGEVVGIAGISGNGQSELLQVISGLAQPDSGRIAVSGKDVTGMSTRNTGARVSPYSGGSLRMGCQSNGNRDGYRAYGTPTTLAAGRIP